jgi:hypothetical protein
MEYTVTEMEDIGVKATQAARNAAGDYLVEKLGGKDNYPCGFAWVTVYPENKGNTKLGKAERGLLESIGFEKDWTGKAYQIWNPSKVNVQNVDVKEAGAQAYADIMKAAGFKAYAGSRLD